MSMPPKFPLNKDGKKLTYFELMCQNAQKYLPEIVLSFDGYEDTVDRYKNVKENESNKNYQLSVEFNAWSEYFSEVANYIQNEYLDAETEKLQVQSLKSIEHNGSVASGDRQANTAVEVITARKKRNALKALYDVLVAKQEFSEKAFYQCKNNYSRNEKGESNGSVH